MSKLTGSNHWCRAQFKCAQTVIGQRSAGNGPNGLSYDYYYYYYCSVNHVTSSLLCQSRHFITALSITSLHHCSANHVTSSLYESITTSLQLVMKGTGRKPSLHHCIKVPRTHARTQLSPQGSTAQWGRLMYVTVRPAGTTYIRPVGTTYCTPGCEVLCTPSGDVLLYARLWSVMYAQWGSHIVRPVGISYCTPVEWGRSVGTAYVRSVGTSYALPVLDFILNFEFKYWIVSWILKYWISYRVNSFIVKKITKLPNPILFIYLRQSLACAPDLRSVVHSAEFIVKKSIIINN